MNDLSRFELVERVIEIVDPKTKTQNVGIRITLKSHHDESLQRIKRKRADAEKRAALRGKTVPTEEEEDSMNELIFATITGWEWYDCKIDGDVPEFNRANVMKILKHPQHGWWFREQLAEAVTDDGSFMRD